MESVVKSDVFFFVTTICVIIVTLVVVVAGAYCIRIASDLKHIVARAKQETDEIADDLKEARHSIKEKGKFIGAIVTSLLAFGAKKKKHSKKDED